MGRLTLEIQTDTRQDSICRNLFITYSSDTIFLERIRLEAYLGYTKVLDSLNPGEYKIYLYGSPDSAELYTLRKFKIYPDKNTRLNIESFVNEESFEIDKKTQLDISKEVGLMEYYGSYSNSSYLISSSPIKDNYGIGFNAGLWSKFGKNCGAIIGNGFGLNYYRFSKDTTLIALPQLKKISESYLNLNWNSNLRLRFTIKNQLLVNLHNYKIAYFDLGVNYALPIVFNHI